MLRREAETGGVKITWNRFVMREGIDWPFLYHGILALTFGSLTACLQAGGRLLRQYFIDGLPQLDHVILQDHGGNYWRHDSLNCDREWSLEKTERQMREERYEAYRTKAAREPWVCQHCKTVNRGVACTVQLHPPRPDPLGDPDRRSASPGERRDLQAAAHERPARARTGLGGVRDAVPQRPAADDNEPGPRLPAREPWPVAGAALPVHAEEQFRLVLEYQGRSFQKRIVQMSRRIELSGKRFGDLVVISPEDTGRWKCLCDCGGVAVKNGADLRSGKLKLWVPLCQTGGFAISMSMDMLEPEPIVPGRR